MVHTDGLITEAIAASLQSFALGTQQRKARLIPICDSTTRMKPAPTWIMSRPFEAFLRTQCTLTSVKSGTGAELLGDPSVKDAYLGVTS